MKSHSCFKIYTFFFFLVKEKRILSLGEEEMEREHQEMGHSLAKMIAVGLSG